MNAPDGYGRPAGDAELDALASVLGQSFALDPVKAREEFDRLGRENLRVFRRNGTVGAGLWLIPMGQWFGGKSVPMTGIAAVGVAPEARGSGVGLGLMSAMLGELAEEGIPLSTLYPATQTLYRKAGYEQAGSRFHYTLDPALISLRDRSLPLRPIGTGDRPAVEAVYREAAASRNGHLDRGKYLWDRVFVFRGEPAAGYLVEEDGRPTGYVCFLERRVEGVGYNLQITDIAAATPGAAARLLTFLADHRSMVPEILWTGGPANPLLALLPEQPVEMKSRMMWMTRITDVEKALTGRGYSPAVETEVHFLVHDSILGRNEGKFVLEVSGGTGRVHRGGTGSLELDIRGVAPLYSGFFSPQALVQAGLARGDERSLALAAGVFGGPGPWMPDMF